MIQTFSSKDLEVSQKIPIFADSNNLHASMVGSININDVYMDILNKLSNEDKLDLISRLVKSMKRDVSTKAVRKDVFASFSTDWGMTFQQRIMRKCCVARILVTQEPWRTGKNGKIPA